ncbi:OmpA family protein [Spongiibacter nanhainus]|uniref:OmpA family protein n=1 Tax=Spongiibacter nanhainus TaxID=2794344 RepID=A0A7T4R155_9GAMM|nr:OmpA family protein [Spongiibacter nanhainus]QQD18521.1 OmpA family protein [Spongiibacter nanhainus]
MKLTVLTGRWIAVAAAAVLATACSIDPYTGEEKTSNTAKGAGMGALGGAILGAAVSDKDHREQGAWIGAAAGAAAGGGYGYYMDRQEAKLRARLEGTGVRVQRVGDSIKLIMPGNITFDTGSSAIQGGFHSVLDSVVLVTKEFDKTLMQINGYTDSTGSFQTNQSLSEDRAQSVARYFMNQGIPSSRIRATGYGPRDPIADNSTASGRSQNRRVELELLPMQ